VLYDLPDRKSRVPFLDHDVLNNSLHCVQEFKLSTALRRHFYARGKSCPVCRERFQDFPGQAS
jgi:hypothetical protein